LFWKKKRPETDTISYKSKNQRKSYRYDFRQGHGFQIDFNGKKVWVVNISAGGMAFNNKNFKLYDSSFIKFTLDIPNFKGDSAFFIELRILKIDKNDICHTIFEQCSLEQHELLHKYVLEMQKHDLAH